jgi:hypothetical protein
VAVREISREKKKTFLFTLEERKAQRLRPDKFGRRKRRNGALNKDFNEGITSLKTLILLIKDHRRHMRKYELWLEMTI